MASFRQLSDGSQTVYDDLTGVEMWRAGGPKPIGIPGASPASVPDFRPGSVMKMGAFAGLVATTGGAVGAWTNTLGYDIIVKLAWLDVTTVSTGAANISVGQTPTSVTTSSANIVAAVSVATTGIKTSALAVKVKNGEFITVTGSADTTGLVMNVYIEYVPA